MSVSSIGRMRMLCQPLTKKGAWMSLCINTLEVTLWVMFAAPVMTLGYRTFVGGCEPVNLSPNIPKDSWEQWLSEWILG